MLPDEIDVLLVQDNPLEVELTLRPLRDLDPACRVGVARDGEEALDYLLGRGAFRHRLGAPLPRVVLLELKLPRVDGVEVLRALRASPRASAAPVVMLVPSGEPRELTQCYQVGANSCVQKPVDFEDFYETIQALGRYWLGRNLASPLAAGQRGEGAAARRPPM
jgi:CheY-like chemotaxis protein